MKRQKINTRRVLKPGACFEIYLGAAGYFYAVKTAYDSSCGFLAVRSREPIALAELPTDSIAFVVRVVDEPFLYDWRYLGRVELPERLTRPETYFHVGAIGSVPYLETEPLDQPNLGRVPCDASEASRHERSNFNFGFEIDAKLLDEIDRFPLVARSGD